MNKLKECYYLHILYNSKLLRDRFDFKLNPTPLYKSQIAELLDVDETDKDFNEWFKYLVEKNVLVVTSKVEGNNGRLLDGYILDFKDFERYISEDSEIKRIFGVEKPYWSRKL